jgi:hypothetical protein
MDLLDISVDTENSQDSDLSDEELAEIELRARRPQAHKDNYGRRGAIISTAGHEGGLSK